MCALCLSVFVFVHVCMKEVVLLHGESPGFFPASP